MKEPSNLLGDRPTYVRKFGIAALVGLGLALAACGQSTPKKDAAADQAAEAPASQPAPTADTQAAEPAAAHYRDDHNEIDEKTRKIGSSVYDGLCVNCHEAGLNRAPQRYILQQMTPESIYHALTEGVMKIQAQDLTDEQKVAVAEYLPGRMMGSGEAVAKPLMCQGEAAKFDRSQPPVFAGWGLEPSSKHFISADVAGLNRDNVQKLKLKWALAFPNAVRARSQPTLAGGAIFVGSHDGTVFALDRETGCARWTFQASAEVRTGIVVSPWKAGDAKAKPLVFFGDLVGNVYALDAFTGKQVWKQLMDEHPSTTLTGTPTLYKGMLYVPVSSLEEGASSNPKYPCCTFRGSLVALDAATGKEAWRTYMIDQPPALTGKNSQGVNKYGPSGVPVWTSPAVDEKRGNLLLAVGDNYSTPATSLSDSIIALDLKAGKVKWHYQATEDDAWNGSCEETDKANCPNEDGPDFDFGAGAALTTASDGRDYVLAGQKSGIAYGIDAETGKLIWKHKVGRGGVVAGIHFGIATEGDSVFVPVSDVPDGNKYPDPPRPGMYALDVKTGDYLWQAPSQDVCGGKKYCHPGYSGAITTTPDLLMAGANDGYIRIYDTKSGKVLWEFDTDRSFTTVNGAPAHGGSMGGGAAPLAYHGDLIMNSGYGFAGKMPGNVLLVFEAK